MKKYIVIIIIVLMIVVGGGGAIAWYSRAVTPVTATTPTTTVQRGPLRIVVASTGRVVSKQDVDIKCKASGEVIKLPFDISDEVHKDDILLQLDTKDQQRAVAKAQAALDASTAQLAQAQQDLVVARQILVTDTIKAQANLLMSQAKQRDADAKLARSHELLAGKLVSQEEYDTVTTTAATTLAELKNVEAQIADLKTSELALGIKEQIIKLQQANLAQNEVNLQIQKLQLEYATVYSPLDGVVSSLTSGKDSSGNFTITRIGSIVQSGTSNVSGGTTVMTISDLSRIFIYATVDESDIGQVIDPQRNPDKPHQLVHITADAYPGREFEGEVVRVATKGVNSNNVVTFEVRIEVTSRNRRLLKPEMTANVEIMVAERTDVLTVPALGIVKQHRQGESKSASQPASSASEPATQQRTMGGLNTGPIPATATVLKPDGSNETRNVTLGITDGYVYEVLSGLSDGETVVLDKFGSDSKWRPGGNRPLGMPIGGGRGR